MSTMRPSRIKYAEHGFHIAFNSLLSPHISFVLTDRVQLAKQPDFLHDSSQRQDILDITDQRHGFKIKLVVIGGCGYVGGVILLVESLANRKSEREEK